MTIAVGVKCGLRSADPVHILPLADNRLIRATERTTVDADAHKISSSSSSVAGWVDEGMHPHGHI